MRLDTFITGVVEGFYGRPWSQQERLTLLARLAAWGLNTYFYAPKDDLHHRALWREPYAETETGFLRELIEACRRDPLQFIYGLGPGLDLCYSDPAEHDLLKKRFTQILDLGGRHFALLFDDIPGCLSAQDRRHFDSFAEAQARVANEMFHWLRGREPEARFLFCPTAYCGRMADAGLGGRDYLEVVGRSLEPAIDILWTGPEIISREITPESLRDLRARLGRKPVLWDNLHANDYDQRRLYCGPYAGRPPALRSELRGILLNPNNEFPANFVPVRTLAGYAALGSDASWDPRAEYLRALREWLPAFATVGPALRWEELVLLGDCFYLPHEEGPEANRLLHQVEGLLQTPPDQWGDTFDAFLELASRVRTLFERLTELRDRELFHTFSRRIWDLKEEMQLMESWLRARRQDPQGSDGILSGDHLAGTYRGGVVSRLQRLLEPDASGKLHPRPCSPNLEKKGML